MTNEQVVHKQANLKPIDESDANLRVARSVNRIYSKQLANILLVMVAYYLMITASHYFFLEQSVRTILMFITSLAAFVSGLIYTLLRLRLLRYRHTHAAFIPAGLLALAAVYSHIFMTQDQLQLTNGIVAFFAFGFVTLSRRVYAFFFLVSSGLYFSTLVLVPGPNAAHFTFMYITASAMSILCFILRYRTTYNAQRLLVVNRQKTSQLVTVSKQMQVETEQARIAAESAERANKAKDAFLANTTHELRTPLTGVLGMLDLLDGSELNEQQKDTVRAAQFSARTLLVVVNDLLDLAKIDAGTFELKSIPFSLSIVTNHVCDLLRPQAEAKALVLDVVGLDGMEQPLIGDPVRIGQILLNLLDNAIKFTNEGTVTVSVQLEHLTDEMNGASDPESEQCQVSISVKDTGVGFDPIDWVRVFSRFEQLDNSATRQAEGAGLGLSICQGIAAHMNGAISVDSDAGKGSEFTFTVTLPTARELKGLDLGLVSRPAMLDNVHQPLGVRDVGNQQPEEDEHDSTIPRILLVEDNQVNQMLMQKLAKKFNWSLEVADNGEIAVLMVEESQPFDLILMDIRMPVMDGVEATKLIKKMPEYRASTPIIALTANTSDEDRQIYHEVGMLCVIGKPIDAVMLKREVDKVLSTKVHF